MASWRGQDAQLPAHATRARWGRDVGGDSHGLEVAVALGDGFAKGDALGAGADGVGGVLDIGAGDVGTEVGEDDGTDSEVAVGAVGGGLGGDGVSLQVMQLLGGQAVGLTRRLEVLVVDAGEERRRHYMYKEGELGWRGINVDGNGRNSSRRP